MKQYLDLVRHVLDHGTEKDQRASLADGRRPKIKSVFGYQMRFDLREGFPLVTTKRVPFKSVVAELIWFISGSTNNNDANRLGTKIWDQWADPVTGELGPVYGKQWRRWPTPAGGTVDQIANLVRDIKAVKADPHASCGRRLVVSAWNPGDQHVEGPHPAPLACHALWQCSVTEGTLSTHLYQRSADIFLGVPFNVASYALLTHMLAQVTGLEVGDFIHSFGDAHIYDNHYDGALELLSRAPRALPRIELNPEVLELDRFGVDDVKINEYDPHPAIKGEVAV